MVAHGPADLQVGLQLRQLRSSTSSVVVITCTILDRVGRLGLIQELIYVSALQTKSQITPVTQAHGVVGLEVERSDFNCLSITCTKAVNLENST